MACRKRQIFFFVKQVEKRVIIPFCLLFGYLCADGSNRKVGIDERWKEVQKTEKKKGMYLTRTFAYNVLFVCIRVCVDLQCIFMMAYTITKSTRIGDWTSDRRRVHYEACCLADTVLTEIRDGVESFGPASFGFLTVYIVFHSCLRSLSLVHVETYVYPHTLSFSTVFFPQSLASLVNCHRAIWCSAGLARLSVVLFGFYQMSASFEFLIWCKFFRRALCKAYAC